MPQWRKLHVKATESLDINDMPDDFTRLLWVLLPLGLDREGRGLDNPAWVKSKAMPLRTDVTLDMVTVAMDWYAGRGMIIRYSTNGRTYFWVPTFSQYQGNTSREAVSNFPPPAEEPITDESRPTQELVESKSSTDVDSDTDTESPKGGKSPAPKRKPFKAPPAVYVFRKAAHRYPPKGWYERIDNAVGRDPPDLEFWHDVVIAYVGMGWNPGNVKTMLEYYLRREIPAGKNGGSNARPPTSHAQRTRRTVPEYKVADAAAFADAAPDDGDGL